MLRILFQKVIFYYAMVGYSAWVSRVEAFKMFFRDNINQSVCRIKGHIIDIGNACNDADALHCRLMEWVCLDWNTPSIAFYKSLGAKPMDEWTIYRLDEKILSSL